jgi:glycolate oxidase iron-sulfur subunit
MPAPPASTASSLPALADRCVQCGLCLPHCPTYRLDAHEAESPRGRIAYVRALAAGQLPATAAGDRHLDHCLGCRRCEAACPAGVEYGELLTLARAEQAGRRRPPPSRRWRLALLARPALLRRLLAIYPRVFSWLPARWRRLPRPEPAGALPAAAAADAALFQGCIASAYESTTAQALARCLQAAGQSLSVPARQTCCGTAAAHAGELPQARILATRNRTAFAGQTHVLCLASGCQQQLARSLEGVAPVSDALVHLDSLGERLRFRSAQGRRIALHLPCSQRVLGSAAALRRLLARVPGLDLLELPDTGCCGAAGLHMLEEPERAARLREPLLAALARSGAVELLSANIGCRLHLAAAARMPVRHPIDFLAEHLA